jgi:hypothetical protein
MGGEGAWHRAQWVCLCLNLNTNNLICIVLSFCFAFLSFHIVYVSHPYLADMLIYYWVNSNTTKQG